MQVLRDIYGANKTSAAKGQETTLEWTRREKTDGGRGGWVSIGWNGIPSQDGGGDDPPSGGCISVADSIHSDSQVLTKSERERERERKRGRQRQGGKEGRREEPEDGEKEGEKDR